MRILGFQHLLDEPILADESMVVSIGAFDGIHIGHQEILTTCVRMAKECRAKSMVITFDRNPKMVTGTIPKRKALTSPRIREEILDDLDIDYLVVIDFSRDFSTLSAVEFLHLVFALCRVKRMVVGEDFHCGNPVSCAGVNELREYLSHQVPACDLFVPPLMRLHDGEVISSTLVRERLTQGDMDGVRIMLGRPYALDLTCYSSRFMGKSLVFRIGSITQMLPPPGYYLSRIVCEGKRSDSLTVRLTDKDLEISSDAPIRIDMLELVKRSDK